jgi:hypothetical protein
VPWQLAPVSTCHPKASGLAKQRADGHSCSQVNSEAAALHTSTACTGAGTTLKAQRPTAGVGDASMREKAFPAGSSISVSLGSLAAGVSLHQLSVRASSLPVTLALQPTDPSRPISQPCQALQNASCAPDSVSLPSPYRASRTRSAPRHPSPTHQKHANAHDWPRHVPQRQTRGH